MEITHNRARSHQPGTQPFEDWLDTKLETLREIISQMGSVVVAYSGGVDSSLVLKVAFDGLKDRAVGVTAVSPSLPAGELENARALADEIGIRHAVVHTHELENPDYLANTTARCFHCKHEVYRQLQRWAAENRFAEVIDGFNLDDLADHRPGHDAGLKLGIKSPLIEAGLGKEEIRELARRLDLPVAEKPALACLSSRIPYGTPVTIQALSRIDHAERFLCGLGLTQVRVRHYGSTARIEVLPKEFGRVLAERAAILTRFRELGYQQVLLDLNGYRPGSLNPRHSSNHGF